MTKVDEEDVEMVDAASAPSPSPFLLLEEPKARGASQAPTVPKFAPKVKPRGAKKQASSHGSVAKAERTPPPKVEQASSLGLQPSIPEENGTATSSANVLLSPKREIETLKQENLEEETFGAPAMLTPKVEPGVHPANVGEGVVAELTIPKSEIELEPKEEPMDPAPPSLAQGDRVVREIDVFLKPSVDQETQLYLLQYPLRPSWRPYGLEERCQEVRVKPQQSKLEVDLVIDTDGTNYDRDAVPHLQIKKQTLTSSKMALSTNYAIGVLRGNQLHLNPIRAVVQLRPSMKYFDDADAAKTKQSKEAIAAADSDNEEMVDAEASEAKPELTLLQVSIRRRETERQEATRLQSHAHFKQLDEAEPWIPLEPHGMDSPVTDGIRRKLIASTNTPIPFMMRPEDYINTLVPGRTSSSTVEVVHEDGSSNAGISRSFLDTLSLEDRFHVLLSKGRVQVFEFERLMKMAPAGCTEAEVLDVLGQNALLVQGCWVAASSLRYEPPMSIIRDYILFLFTKHRVILPEQLEELRVPKEVLREIMLSLAVQRRAPAGWEFQECADKSFIKKHQGVAKAQAIQWIESEEGIKQAVMALTPSSLDSPVDLTTNVGSWPSDKGDSLAATRGKTPHNRQTAVPALTNRTAKAREGRLGSVADGDHDRGKGGAGDMELTGRMTMSKASQDALPGALREIFLKHHVCSLQLICQSLREGAIDRATNSNQQSVAAAIAAAQGASAALPELAAAVSKMATNIGNVYFLTSLGSPALDPFRRVVIALLQAKGPNSGLRRTDIMEASKIALRTEVPPTTYQKVMKELCYTRGGAWVLKPGDGRPP